jgi:hypothetical protein
MGLHPGLHNYPIDPLERLASKDSKVMLRM